MKLIINKYIEIDGDDKSEKKDSENKSENEEHENENNYNKNERDKDDKHKCDNDGSNNERIWASKNIIILSVKLRIYVMKKFF
ncbi:unnamed protein product [Rhizophagus irregularis]|nr:unnamed protein product [Rhizophagus irregularis]